MSSFYFELQNAENPELVGRKAYMIGRLIRSGGNVPNGGVLTTELMKWFLVQAGCQENQIEKALSLDPDAIAFIKQHIKQSIWPEEIRILLRSIYQGFSGSLCIRSSSVSEDGAQASFAGIFHSSVNVRTFGEFLQAIRDCWASAFDDPVIQYISKLGGRLPLMAVIIQDFVDTLVSGVAFLEMGRLFVSSTYGLCEGVVSGKAPSDTFIWDGPHTKPEIKIADKNSSHFANISSGSYWPNMREIRPWFNNQTICIDVKNADDRNAILNCCIFWAHRLANIPSLNENFQDELSQTLYGMVDTVLDTGGWDIEWGIDCTGEIHIFQARPITTSLNTATFQESISGKMIFSGEPISRGEGSGPARWVYTDDDLKRVEQGDIVVMDWIPDTFMSVLPKAHALAIYDRSPLSHCAIVAREWKIPCVGGVPHGTLLEGHYYRVDGSSGKIYQETGIVKPSMVDSHFAESQNVFYIYPWLFRILEDIDPRPNRMGRYLSDLKRVLNGLQPNSIVDIQGIGVVASRYETMSPDSSSILLMRNILRLLKEYQNVVHILTSPNDLSFIEGIDAALAEALQKHIGS